MNMRKFVPGSLALVVGGLGFVAMAEGLPDDLISLDLEDLMEIEITSVSKKAQSIGDAASAIYVLTGQEIKSAGVTTIPDALRLVPGISVGRINADKWAIGVRGGQQLFSNELLVLIDGRSVYWSLYSGVLWVLQDMVLDDIDRIEVIRGPGASVWGANAVNGVINIITKKPSETLGSHVASAIGTNGDGFLEIRQGGSVGEKIDYRAFAKARRFDERPSANGLRSNDELRDARTGFRADIDGEKDSFVFQGQIAHLQIDESRLDFDPAPPFAELVHADSEITAGFLMGSWTRDLDDGGIIGVKGYIDTLLVSDYLAETKRARYHTADVEVTHQFDLAENHDLILGAGFRSSLTDLFTIGDVAVDLDRADNVFSGFIQDDITVLPDRLKLTFGLKVEHNDFSGIEVQPTARALYKLNSDHSLWGAVSRAVRTPSPLNRDVNVLLTVAPPTLLTPLPTVANVVENPNVDSEVLWAFEAGYRGNVTETLGLDIATFFNRYEDVVGLSIRNIVVGGAPPAVNVTQQFDNNIAAESFGGEISFDFRPDTRTRLRAGYSFTRFNAHATDGTPAEQALVGLIEDNHPEHQIFAHLSHKLADDLDISLIGRLVDHVPNTGVGSYGEFTAHLAWRPVEGVELSLTGQNLLHDKRQEYATEFPSGVSSKVERSVYAKVSVDF